MTASSGSEVVPNPPTRHLTWLYVTALSFVALLTIAGQILTQRSIARQLDDSRIVNLAGRQRMLSQRLTQLALRLEREPSRQRRRELQEQFSEAFASWTETHAGLRYGSESLSLPENDSAVVEAMFAALDEAYLPMQRAGETMLVSNGAGEGGRLAEATDAWLARETAFLDGMDAIVFQYDAEARERVARLRIIEAALLAATLATLAAEATLIFRPSVRRLRHYVERLRELNAELTRAERRAVEADAAKTQFLAGMSHELRTPMSAILGAAEISSERATDPAAKRLLHALHQSAKSLSGMLDELLDLASFDAGAGPQIASELFHVRQTVDRVAELFRPSAERKGLSFAARIGPTVPRLAVGDEKRIAQILSNLLSNAIKFTDEGSVEFHAWAEAASEDLEHLIVEVVDTGPGVPSEHAERIFERFARVDPSLRRKAGGAGLGLAISSELARAMGGAIEFDRQRATGSRFTLRLPLRRMGGSGGDSVGTDQLNSASSDAAIEARIGESPCSRRALIADDSDANRLLLAERLRDLGYQVTETSNGHDAVDAAVAGSFHAVLLDVEMPELDGLAAAGLLKEKLLEKDEPLPRLIAVTAHPQEAIRSRCLEAGFDEALSKPVSLSALRQALRRERPESERAGQHVEPLPSSSEHGPEPESAAEQIVARFRRRETLLVRLIELYLAESAELHARLRSAVASENVEEIARVVHRWRGAGSNFGSSELDESFTKFETGLAADGPSSERLVELVESIARFEIVLRKIGAALSGERQASRVAPLLDQES
ncbi:MAG TPA: ATP-binding protein [Pirellulaceae bacterium]|jgi:signal transduction histidine kinase/CheY-like chemotaxis protein/HPt (histidine-containing phosphotransfer) domain-containing protein|nr:ATP-binding protein [Pirellulaceae bacterium]